MGHGQGRGLCIYAVFRALGESHCALGIALPLPAQMDQRQFVLELFQGIGGLTHGFMSCIGRFRSASRGGF